MIHTGPRGRGKDCLIFGLLLLLGGCATAPKQLRPSTPAPSPEELAMKAASDEFSAGREAALSGDFACAHDRFERALEAMRPAASARPSPEKLAFELDLYEGILRYEALSAPPPEE